MSIQEMKTAADGIEEVAKAIRSLAEPTRKIRLDRALRRAAGDAGGKAVSAVSSEAKVSEELLDEWASRTKHGRIAEVLDNASMRLRWRAELAGRPDDLAKILKDRMERGMAYMPKVLLATLYEVGANMVEIKAGREPGAGTDVAKKKLMDLAAEWAVRVERAGDHEDGVVVCVAPF